MRKKGVGYVMSRVKGLEEKGRICREHAEK